MDKITLPDSTVERLHTIEREIERLRTIYSQIVITAREMLDLSDDHVFAGDGFVAPEEGEKEENES